MMKRRYIAIGVLVLAAIVLIFTFGYQFFIQTHAIDDLVTVETGDTIIDVAIELGQKGVSTSRAEVRVYHALFGLSPKAGTYQFNEPANLHDILSSIDQHENVVPAVELVVPEGFSNQKIINRLQKLVKENDLSEFDVMEFANLAADHEGYLFPDTYYLYPETTATDLLDKMLDNFRDKTSNFGANLSYEEIILASIIEREVATAEDRAMVADILLRRLELGMRLQVDATLDYYLGKPSSEITKSDLETDHPYNTYTRGGLPPTPISNPGLDSIQAVQKPQPNDYLYYLSAPDGTTYYATTLAEHVENKELYL